MKRLYIYIILATSLLTTSCSEFLNIRAVGSVDEIALLNEGGIEMVITGMYSTIYTGSFENSITNYTYGDVLGGSANKGTTFTDQSDFTSLETYSITTDNGYLNNKWENLYNGVFRANNLLSMTEKMKEELSLKTGESLDYYTETVAQARFFRAFWHFEGVKLFGAAIPYIGNEEFASGVNPLVSNVDEGGAYIYIWEDIIADFQFAYDNLPNVWTKDQGRVNKWAAAAMLAKTMMFQSSPYNGKNNTVNKWAEVKSLLEVIMASGTDNQGTQFRLADSYASLFIAGQSDWTGESIFDVQTVIMGTQTNTNAVTNGPHCGLSGALGTSGWGFLQPSAEMANSHIVGAEGLPMLDKAYTNLPALTVRDASGLPQTDLAVYTDPRLDVSVGRFHVPFYDWAIPKITDGWVRDASNGGFFITKKNLPRKADKGTLSVLTSSGSTAKNYHIIRYADLLLWYAEALIENGQHVDALEYVNEVRSRAANTYTKAADPTTMEETTSIYELDDLVNGTTKTNAAANYRIGLYSAQQFATKESATAALRFERKLELALEGHRWYDLARWGESVITKELTEYLSFEKKYLSKFRTSVYNEKWVTMPIPNDQIITMEGVLVQNENWN